MSLLWGPALALQPSVATSCFDCLYFLKVVKYIREIKAKIFMWSANTGDIRGSQNRSNYFF